MNRNYISEFHISRFQKVKKSESETKVKQKIEVE